MTVSAVLSLLNLASVGVFGIVLSAAFCDLEWTRQRKGILAVSTVLMLALQAVVSLHWGTGLARYLYPVITHLPLFLLLAVLTGKWLWPLVAVLTAYLCCQLRRWAALLVIALFPAGGTVLQDAMELLVTLPLLAALVRWCAPSVRSLSHSPLSLQLQFGIIPLLSYASIISPASTPICSPAATRLPWSSCPLCAAWPICSLCCRPTGSRCCAASWNRPRTA